MARDWCFTSFVTDKLLDFEKDKIRYICYGRERCPTTDREHYQGFAIFKRTCRIPKAKEWIGGGDGTHLEPRRGSRDEARNYCRKSDGEFIEWGQYEALTQEQLFGQPIGFLKKEYPAFYCRYYKGLERLQSRGPKWRNLKVYILWGATGTGKTRQVMEKEDVYKLDPPYQWWDGYEGEKILLIDDYKVGAISRGQLLNILDGYQLRLETKGSHTWALWEEVYITTNYNPETWDDAVLRRVCQVTALGGNTIPPA